MLLKSTSTPVLGSLLAPLPESPSNNHHQCEISSTTAKQTPQPSSYSKLSHAHSRSQNLKAVSCNSSPMSHAVGCLSNGFQRARSEGNLECLANASGNIDEFSFKNVPSKYAREHNCLLLDTIPSFSFHNLSPQREYEDHDEEDEVEEFSEEDDCSDNSYNGYGMETTSLQVNMRYGIGYANVIYEGGREQMYLARGLGVADIGFVDSCGHGGGNDGGCRPVAFDRDGGNSHGIGMEEYYKKMLEENPSNPLLLRNYAQFLYHVKRDLEGAENYYWQAILADPGDGEVLSHYAELVWELHHDKHRATNYFERAVQAASGDSHVHAAYARFLWEVEDTEDGED